LSSLFLLHDRRDEKREGRLIAAGNPSDQVSSLHCLEEETERSPEK